MTQEYVRKCEAWFWENQIDEIVTVIVKNKTEDELNGWYYGWASGMEAYLGKEFEIKLDDIETESGRGILIKNQEGRKYWFPIESFEVIIKTEDFELSYKDL